MATENHTPERTYCVYRIVCFPTGKVYVGQALNFRSRIYEHFRQLKKGEHKNSHLQRAYDKYGRTAFYSEALEYNVLPENVNERECYWISVFDSHANGFNCTEGGSNGITYAIPIVWNGIAYEALSIAAQILGLSVTTMSEWNQKGYRCDADVPHYRKSVTWNGIEYSTQRAAALACGVTATAMSRWLSKGYACDQDVPKRGASRRQPHIWNGIQYVSLTACAEANNVTRAAMIRRFSQGYTCDDDIPINKRKRRNI